MIYNHSFSGNRLEGLCLSDYLCQDYALVVYDCRGCGINKSDYVTLGLRESEDLDYIVEELIKWD